MNPVMMAIFVSGALFVGMLVCIEIGYRLGHSERFDNRKAEGLGAVEAAIFGLLGLILAFTFSGASERLVIRRDLIVQEANVIGTGYQRIDLLPASEQPSMRVLFREYLESRIEVFDKANDLDSAKEALEKSGQIQRQIWSHGVTACRADPRPEDCLLFLPALNDMFDVTTTRTMAALTHVPITIFGLLLLLALLAALLSGFAMSSGHKREPLHMVLFALAISISIYVVLDLEYPRSGIVNLRSADQLIHQLRETME